MKCHVLWWMFRVCALWEELLMRDMEIIALEPRTFHSQISEVIFITAEVCFFKYRQVNYYNFFYIKVAFGHCDLLVLINCLLCRNRLYCFTLKYNNSSLNVVFNYDTYEEINTVNHSIFIFAQIVRECNLHES